MTSPSLVRGNGLRKDYQRGSETVRALKDVNLELFKGEVVALIGPSGSGKSTLLNLLARWEQPDAGQIEWLGAPGEVPIEWRDVTVVPQKLGLISELSVEENIDLPLRFAASDADLLDAGTLIERLGLERLAERLPSEVSVGEQQRTALARALITRPQLLLLDEPTGHQDAAWVTEMFALLRTAAEMGACSLVATHNPEVLPYCDRVLAIRDGRLEESQPIEPDLPLEPERAVKPVSDGHPHSAWRRTPT